MGWDHWTKWNTDIQTLLAFKSSKSEFETGKQKGEGFFLHSKHILAWPRAYPSNQTMASYCYAIWIWCKREKRRQRKKLKVLHASPPFSHLYTYTHKWTHAHHSFLLPVRLKPNRLFEKLTFTHTYAHF